MLMDYYEEHWSDDRDRPAGGVSSGRGFAISWQNGPLGRDGDRVEPNGAFVEGVLAAVIGRLEFYQASEFACHENAAALANLRCAVGVLDERTKNREERQVEGTHAG